MCSIVSNQNQMKDTGWKTIDNFESQSIETDNSKISIQNDLSKHKRNELQLIAQINGNIKLKKPQHSSSTKPAFLTGILLDPNHPCYFKLTVTDIYGGNGQIPLWIRHALLTHIRNHQLEDKFLASLAAIQKHSISELWNDVLNSLGIPEKHRSEMKIVDKLTDETEWVARTLIEEKVRTKVLKELYSARKIVDSIIRNEKYKGRLIDFLKKLSTDSERINALKILGFKPRSAEKITSVLKSNQPSSHEKLKSIIDTEGKKIVSCFDEIIREVKYSNLGRYRVLIDFKPELEEILNTMETKKVKNNFLESVVRSAQNDAQIKRTTSNIVITAIDLLSTFIHIEKNIAIITSKAPLLLKLLWESLEIGSGVLEHIPFIYKEHIEETQNNLLKRVRIGNQ